MSTATSVQKRPAAVRLSATAVILGILLLLTLVGGAAGIYRLFKGLGATSTP